MSQTVTSAESPSKRRNARTAEHTLRWVLAHEPPVVFEEAAQVFADLVRENTNGDIDVEMFLGDEYKMASGRPSLTRKELVECVIRGDIEMAHCYVSALGAFHDPLWAIELPFLFRDYEHAERVFEGPVAQELMDGMRPLGLRGIGFAYSGGYRIVPTIDCELRSVADFAGLTLRTSGNPVPEAMYRALGAKAIGADLEEIAPMARAGDIRGCEITYVRFNATKLDSVFDVVNETSHSLFTTMTVANDRWFRKLSDAQQAAIVDAGRAACRIERETAIREEAVTAKAYAEQGLRIVRMDEASHAQLRETALGVYDTLTPRFGEALIDGIRTS